MGSNPTVSIDFYLLTFNNSIKNFAVLLYLPPFVQNPSSVAHFQSAFQLLFQFKLTCILNALVLLVRVLLLQVQIEDPSLVYYWKLPVFRGVHFYNFVWTFVDKPFDRFLSLCRTVIIVRIIDNLGESSPLFYSRLFANKFNHPLFVFGQTNYYRVHSID